MKRKISFSNILAMVLIISTSALTSCSDPEEVLPELPVTPEVPGNDSTDGETENPGGNTGGGTVIDGLTEWTSETRVAEVEAESGILSKANTSKQKTGYSGTGYVDGMWQGGASLTVKVNVTERALYRIKMTAWAEGGNQHQILFNGKTSESHLITVPKSNGFTALDMGKYVLEKGENEITILAGWGEVMIDKFEVLTAVRNSYDIAPAPINPNITAEAKDLYQFLLDNFGKKIISGHMEAKGVNGINRQPMLNGWDFSCYTEGYPWKWSNETGGHVLGAVDGQVTEAAIKWYESTNRKGIVTFHWHWCSPTGGRAGVNTFYTENTTFDITKAVQEGTDEYNLCIRDIDAIAVQLKKLQDKKVPVIFRPLHEAGGGWFWWGAKGAKPCLKMWDILYDRITNYHKINNLLWVWSTNEEDWYPGDDKLDMIGYDSYPADGNTATQTFMYDGLYHLTNGHKLIAMTENGPIPDPEVCIKYDAPWALFMTWGDLLYSGNTTQHISEVYSSPYVLSLSK